MWEALLGSSFYVEGGAQQAEGDATHGRPGATWRRPVSKRTRVADGGGQLRRCGSW